MSLSKELLEELYNGQRLSMAEIAEQLGCSPNKVVYWMSKHGIPRRDVSEAIYQWHNPGGDPFDIRLPETEEERDLFRLALGLYLGEGKKLDQSEVAIANTDPRIIRAFMRFLREICRVDEVRIWAWINIFDDANLGEAQAYWEEVTGLASTQFYRPTVRPRRGGDYANLSKYGTLSVGVSNTKLHWLVMQWCEQYLEKYGS